MMLSEKARSPVSEHRKVTKSAMEKKRRARINSSLTELKSILAGIMAYKDERFEKMEKADILEMTVNYVRQLQNKSVDKDKPSQRDDGEYRTGVSSCIGEMIRYVTASEICDTETKTKLLDHLANKVSSLSSSPGIAKISPSTSPTSPVNTVKPFTIRMPESGAPMSSIADVNNNIKVVGIQTQPTVVGSNNQTAPVSVYTTQLPLSSVQTVNTYTPQIISPVKSIQPALNVQNIAPVGGQVTQASSQVVPNVPLTILVPANICATATGTTCVIPLQLANNSNLAPSSPLDTSVVLNTRNSDSGVIIGNTKTDVDDKLVPMQNTVDPESSTCGINLVKSNQDGKEHSVITDSSPKDMYDVNSRLSQEQSNAINVPSEQVYERTVNGQVRVLDCSRENMPVTREPVSSPVQSEYGVFQKYPHWKSPSHFNRKSSMWRPW